MESSICYYALVTLGSAIFCASVVFILKIPFFHLSTSTVRQLNIILNQSLGEDEKDKQIIRNLLVIIKNISVVLVLLLLVVLLGIFPVMIFLYVQRDFEVDTTSIMFYGTMFLGSFSLLFFRSKGNYSYWSKLFHTIILDNYNIGIFFFNKEVKKVNPALPALISENQPFVIVSGLARAGTTALTNLLCDEDKFHFITYANVPFLLSPNSWKKIYSPKYDVKKKRSHGDGVLFGIKSIEALEEYFFKVFLNNNYIQKNRLVKHEISKELFAKYCAYQQLFRKNPHTIYIAKNNNFILRFESMRKQSKAFKLIVIFREPLAQAMSLLNQHKNFTRQQTNDQFILKYMNWLGHYEFGLNQKYFELGNQKMWEKYDKNSIAYWIGIWLNYYSYVLNIIERHEIVLVHYDDLLKKPNELKQALAKKIQITLDSSNVSSFKSTNSNVDNINELDRSLLNRVDKFYHKLIEKKFKIEM